MSCPQSAAVCRDAMMSTGAVDNDIELATSTAHDQSSPFVSGSVAFPSRSLSAKSTIVRLPVHRISPHWKRTYVYILYQKLCSVSFSSVPVHVHRTTLVQPSSRRPPSIMRLTGKEETGHNMVSPEKMADEHTPLISTVRTAPPRQRYPHHVVRRFCTIALSCSLVALFATFLVVFGFSGPLERHERNFSWPGCDDRHLSYEGLKKILLETPSSEKAEEWQKYYTGGAHLAGQNYSQVRLYTPPPLHPILVCSGISS